MQYMYSQFIVRNADADCSSEAQSILISAGELKLCKACACTKCLDETKWSETRDKMPRPFGPRPKPYMHSSETETRH